MKAQKPVGRLELTWTNKHLRLLAQEDGSYEWVEPSDHRVAEVRLLRDAGRIGDKGDGNDPENLLIRGDALHALLSLSALPEYQETYAGGVRLVYIDPPFNTQQSFLQYDDALEHSVWLTMMRDRLLQARQLMAPDATVWVHLDDSEMAYCKVMMDEVFGRECFVGTVIWEKSDSPRMDAKTFSVRHDYILVYGRSPTPLFRGLSYDATAADHVNKVDEEGRPYYLNPLRARGPASSREDRPSMYFGLRAPDGTDVFPKRPDGSDGRWRWGAERFGRDSHLVEWVEGRNGWNPYYRVYPEREATRPAETIWFFKDVGSNRTSKKEIKALFPRRRAFETPKPEALMRRIIEVATNPGDLVLDFFVGSGTTAAVAHKLGRRWLAVEHSEGTLSAFTLPRLRMVAAGADLGGVTEEAEWKGGGAFRVVDVGPTMFTEVAGVVVLADWASGGELGEATAAQLSFSYDPSLSPFCGRKGRCRLAVIDGRVNEAVVELLSGFLSDDQTMLICATSLDPAARDVLPRGSRLQKIPSSILDQYRRQYRSRRRSELGIESPPEPATEPLAANA